MGFAPPGLCSEFVFLSAGVALHFTTAYYPPSLRDFGCGTKELRKGERIFDSIIFSNRNDIEVLNY
jgi:hypothetical protein